MENKQISVIIPVYNMEKSLKKCLDSVLAQKNISLELICVDDGSVDGSVAVLEDYALKFQGIRVLKQKNNGPGSARNFGLKMAQGEFVAFMDADDIYPANDVLECLYRAATQNNVLICGGRETDQDGNILDIFERDIQGHILEEGKHAFREYQCPWGYLRYIYRRDLLNKNSIFFPDYRRGQDPVFFVNAMVNAGDFFTIDKIVYVYNGIYEPTKWDERKIYDYFSMAYDLLVIGIREKYEKLNDEIIVRVFAWLYFYFYYFSCKNEKMFLELIDKLCEIRPLVLKEEQVYWLADLGQIKDFMGRLAETKSRCESTIKEYQYIYIYGAGIYGKKCKRFLETWIDRKPEAFFVSEDRPVHDMVEGINVRRIEENMMGKSAVVLIAVKGEELRERLRHNAVTCGYENVILMDCEMLKYCEQLELIYE